MVYAANPLLCLNTHKFLPVKMIGHALLLERAIIHGGMVESVRCGIIVEITAVARLIAGSKVVFIRHGCGRLAKVKQFQRHKAVAADFVPFGIPLDG